MKNNVNRNKPRSRQKNEREKIVCVSVEACAAVDAADAATVANNTNQPTKEKHSSHSRKFNSIQNTVIIHSEIVSHRKCDGILQKSFTNKPIIAIRELHFAGPARMCVCVYVCVCVCVCATRSNCYLLRQQCFLQYYLLQFVRRCSRNWWCDSVSIGRGTWMHFVPER